MKTIRTILLCAISILAISCQKNSYKITISLPEDWKEGTADLIIPFDDEARTLATAKIENGQVTFKGTQDTAMYRLLHFISGEQELSIPVVVEPGNIEVKYTKDGLRISGTQYNDKLQEVIDIEAKEEQKLTELYNAYFQTAEDEDALRKEIDRSYDSIGNVLLQSVIDFVKANNDNPVGACALASIIDEVDVEEGKEILSNAGPLFEIQPGILLFKERLATLERIAPGQQFSDIEGLQTPQGDAAKLSDYAGKGNYLVVDFWASWCRPCCQSMPELKRIYDEYRSKGVEILGISFDQDKEAWIGAIQKLELHWSHISDLKGWNAAATQVYAINSIPHLMLIAPDGTIVARGLNDETLEQKLKEIFQ